MSTSNNKNNTNKKNSLNKNGLEKEINDNESKSTGLADSQAQNDIKAFESVEINIQILEELKSIRKISKKILKSLKNTNN